MFGKGREGSTVKGKRTLFLGSIIPARDSGRPTLWRTYFSVGDFRPVRCPDRETHVSNAKNQVSNVRKSQFIVGEQHVSLRSHWTADRLPDGLGYAGMKGSPVLGVSEFTVGDRRSRIPGSPGRVI